MTTKELVLRVTTSRAIPEDYIDWGVAELVRGKDTPALRILAGLSPRFDRDEIRTYFRKAWAESGRQESELRTSPLDGAKAARALYDEGGLAPDAAVRTMADLYAASDYSEWTLWPWWELGEELAWEPDEGGYFYPEAVGRPLAPIVAREWELFDLARARELPASLRELRHCGSCRSVAEPQLEWASWQDRLIASFPWVRMKPARGWVCRRCGGTELKSLIDANAREAYLLSLPPTSEVAE